MPHYNRPQAPTDVPLDMPQEKKISDDMAEDAGAALRETEVDASQPEPATTDDGEFAGMTFDELQRLAVAAGVPQENLNSDRDQLIAAIQERRSRK